MNFIVETDLGHDPDDLFCICHLVEAGHTILALGLVPGSPEQVALACGLREHLCLPCYIGVAKPGAKSENLGIHDQLRKKHGWAQGHTDGKNQEVFSWALNDHPDTHALAIGPAPGLGQVAGQLGHLIMQGGFLPYDLYMPQNPLSQFLGKSTMGSFNFNGHPQAITALTAQPGLARRFCGKNVCHGVILDRHKAERFRKADSVAGNLYLTAMRLYLDKHEEKKMHDPTALVCGLHPEIAQWFRGSPVRVQGQWTTQPGEDLILADVDHDALWQCFFTRQ